MATITIPLTPEGARFPASNFPQIEKIDGTNTSFFVLKFDAATDEACFFDFVATGYGSGNLTVSIGWYADTATSGVVQFGAQIAAITPNTDSQDVETDALATASTATDTHLGTTGQRLHEFDITVSNLDSLAADDLVTLKLYRDADDASDTMTGDCLVKYITVSYSDT